MSWERDLMSWERDKYFFSHVPSVLPYVSVFLLLCFRARLFIDAL